MLLLIAIATATDITATTTFKLADAVSTATAITSVYMGGHLELYWANLGHIGPSWGHVGTMRGAMLGPYWSHLGPS
jgi:hypothetical protein